MKKEELLFGVIGLLAGLIAGFFLTNWYNESVVGTATTGSAPAAASATATQDSLSPEEIRQLIQRADDAPTNISFQKEVGISLYRYGASVEDANLVAEAVRLLDRVYTATPQDRETLVALGNSHFDIGYFRKENQSFEKARKFYSEALAIQPGDADVRVDYGLTYALQNPPVFDKAITEYQTALTSVPTHQRTLQMLTDALISTKKKSLATETLERLRTANPTHPMLGDFEKRIAGL